ncbi:MAG: hypothetical protein EXR68_03575 [Dehalococcoidia bacterium]|nr:hypothetical protein [Dehalococcoidia bacterium]
MTTQRSAPRSSDSTWPGLVTLEPQLRATAIRERFELLLALPDGEMDINLEEMIVAEYALDVAGLYTLTASRLRALLGIAEQDPERARRLQRAYDRVFDHLPGALAMRRTVVVQTIARTELSVQEAELLRGLAPSLLEQLPRAATSVLSSGGTPQTAAAQGEERKPWWKAWPGLSIARSCGCLRYGTAR